MNAVQSLLPAPSEPGGSGLRRVLGIGASAGGMAALAELVEACPRDAGIACIVVQHLPAQHPSGLTDTLRRRTRMTVVDADDGQRLEADHVYVIQPGTVITVEGGRLRVAPVAHHALPYPIDLLFRSMARDLGPQAVGVVLSGMGADGSQGLRAIVAAGGRALVQQPESAQFDAMPRNAAAAVGAAATLARPDRMPALALQAQGQGAAVAADAPDDTRSGEDLSAILLRLAAVTGHDFSLYKESSLRRRIERRLASHGLTSLAEYRRVLADSVQEVEFLQKELFIGVTGFFRDPAVWEGLARTALPARVARAAQRGDGRLRAWVVGCSTGEEAYTLAMLLQETLAGRATDRPVDFQIFATDANADAIALARRGLYPASALEAISPQRRAQFFVAEAGGWRVAKALREKVLFARHDIISDAPFSKIDLVSCRNLLIYLRASLQEKVLRLFHYVLQPDGILVLGNSEALGRAEVLFEPVDAKLRIHRRADAARGPVAAAFPIRPHAADNPTPEEAAVSQRSDPSAPTLQSLADRFVLDEITPAAVLVDPAGDILYVSGRTGRFIEPAAGKANWNVHAMARQGLRAALANGVRQALDSGKPVECRGQKMQIDEAVVDVDLLMRPVSWAGHGALVMVVFRELAPAAPRRRRRAVHDQELERAVEEAQALREEMRTSQEELQATNEELQSTNEELQSTNEELTTSKEEMQAMNEELQTVNAELMSKIEDLAQTQSDLRNLLNSTQIATLFLDGRMNVRRFTEQAKKVINLRESDVGRPLTDLTTSLDYPELIDDVGSVLRTLEFRERVIHAVDGRRYSVRIMPYRTADNVIDGSVITFIDLTAARELEARLHPAAKPRGRRSRQQGAAAAAEGSTKGRVR